MAAKTFRQMTDNEFKAAAQQIVRTSASEDEVRQRIKNELGYPYGISITSHLPQDNTGRQARSIVRALGGLTLTNGAMVMVMMHGQDGVINL